MRSTRRMTTPKDVTNTEETTVNLNDGEGLLKNKCEEDSAQAQETNLTAISYPVPVYEKNKAISPYFLDDNNISTKSQYLEALRNSIVKVKPVNGELAIALKFFYTYHTPENFKLFGMLLKSKINFYFFDPKNPEIKQYDNERVNVIFNYCSEIKENRLTLNIPDNQKSKQEIRNPDLLTPKYIDYTSRKRTQKSYFDPTNIKVWLEICRLQIAGFNDNKIANTLNTNGWFSSRGGTYTAKQIARQVERNKKLTELFNPHPREEEFLRVENHRNLPKLPIADLVCRQDVNLIYIYFSEKIEEDIYVQIVDNQEEDKFSNHLTPSSMEIKIDILKDTTMYPGRNYIILTSAKHEEYRKAIDVHPELSSKTYFTAEPSAGSN